MPTIDKYGTQQPIALLKFLIEKGYIYERGGTLDQKVIKDLQFVSAILPPGGGTNAVDPRLLSLYSCFVLLFPTQENLDRIYSSILKQHVSGFEEEINALVSKITKGTLKLYQQIVENLPRTPMKFHYIFNLRDLSRVYEGLCRSTVEKFGSKEKFLRLWRNELERVFVDRLISEEDRQLIGQKLLPQILNDEFADVAEAVLANPLLVGDYMTANPADPEAIDPKLYEDCGDFEKVGQKFNNLLQDYNYEDTNSEMNLVLFKDALSHLTKISRIIRFPRGHGLLVGYGGSGKQSLTRLATFTAGYKTFTI